MILLWQEGVHMLFHWHSVWFKDGIPQFSVPTETPNQAPLIHFPLALPQKQPREENWTYKR